MPENPEERDIVAILTPVPNGKVLAALCAVNGAHGQVIETSAGAFAVLDDASEGAADKAGEAISAFVKTQPVLAMERRAGQLTVTKWEAGENKGTLPPGLALDQAPGAITTLLTGAQTIDELAETHADKVFSARTGRIKALRDLRKLAKQAKAQQQG